MRLRLGWFTLVIGGAIVLGGASAAPAHANHTAQSPAGCALPESVDEAQAQAFESELRDIWLSFNPNGTVDQNQSLSNLLGFPGKYDLPPGELIATAITNDISNLPCPDPGDGSKLSGPCIGMAMSFDGDGHLLDIAADLSPDGAPIDIIESREKGEVVRAFSKGNPFQVDVDGFVAYVGKAGENGQGPTNHHWSIKTFGAELDSGGDPNGERKNRNAGAVNLKDDLPTPAKVNAVFKIEGHMEADDGFVCDGAGYFETTGGLPIAGGAGVLAIVGAGLGALFNARPAKTWRGN
jgi:hypothetical protein